MSQHTPAMINRRNRFFIIHVQKVEGKSFYHTVGLHHIWRDMLRIFWGCALPLYTPVFHLAISNKAQRHVAFCERHVALHERHVALHVRHVALRVRHVALLIFRQYEPL